MSPADPPYAVAATDLAELALLDARLPGPRTLLQLLAAEPNGGRATVVGPVVGRDRRTRGRDRQEDGLERGEGVARDREELSIVHERGRRHASHQEVER